jgi:hypothetical protein
MQIAVPIYSFQDGKESIVKRYIPDPVRPLRSQAIGAKPIKARFNQRLHLMVLGSVDEGARVKPPLWA